jgi:hypothetical protein
MGDSPDAVRQITISSRLLKAAVGGVAVVFLLALGLLSILVFNGSASLRAHRLATENEILAKELASFRSRVTGLEANLADLGKRDSRIRVLAGLEGTDEEILEVGIGGPGLGVPETNPLWTVDSTLSKEAFSVEYDLNALERRARLLTESVAEATDSLLAHNDLLESTPSILPAAGVLSSRFSTSRLHPIYHRELPHEGVDISAPRGTPILASAKGIVTFAGWMSGLGNTIEIDHGYGYKTRYGHASKLLVRRGQEVIRGEVIAQVGSTGISTSPHLHYEVRIGGKAVNPMNYVIGNILP